MPEEAGRPKKRLGRPRRRGPSLREQYLGQQLRGLRERAKLTLKEAGDYLVRDPATISRFESGTVPCRPADVQALLNLYGVEEPKRREEFDHLAREVWRRGWWEGYGDTISDAFVDYAWLEDRAEEIRSYDAVVVPGVLQTRDYAQAVIRAAELDSSDEARMERYVEFRMARQRVLDKGRPLYRAILDEAVLRRVVGGPDVMRAQLARLRELADHPQVELCVMPFRVGAHASPYGTFRVIVLPEPYPEVAYTATLGGAVYVESDGVQRFARAYDQLKQLALASEQTAELISEVLEET